MVLLGGVVASAAGWLPAAWSEPRKARHARNGVDDIGGAIVPANRVSLATYGGVPGAHPADLRNAFGKAFADLNERGGGTLSVPAGLYDFGSYAESTSIITGNGLNNIAISAYGATFTATTTANVMPHMFYFFNFNNLTIAGARFADLGFNPRVNWKGMYCAGIQSDRTSRGFRMVDCYAERVVGLFAANNNAATRQYLADISIQGEVRNAYYGVGASFIREQVKVKLACHNVRRAFIANALKDADITVTASSTADWPGSNGFIALISGGAAMGNVDNVRIRVDASGVGIYGAYVHFYHQGPERDGTMRDVDATVNLNNVSGAPNLFVFDHETNGVQPRTTRAWDRIYLHGRVAGSFAGRVISNPSASSSPGTVYVDGNLVSPEKVARLPGYFRIKSL